MAQKNLFQGNTDGFSLSQICYIQFRLRINDGNEKIGYPIVNLNVHRAVTFDFNNEENNFGYQFKLF